MKKLKLTKNVKIFAVVVGALIVIFGAYTVIYPPQKTFSGIVGVMEFEKSSDLFYDYETSRYPSNVEVVDFKSEQTVIGFNIDPDKLSFGSVPANGSYSSKKINFTGMTKNSKIHIMARGEIAPFVAIERPEFIIKRGENAEVDIVFTSRKDGTDIPIGNYTGEIVITVQIPRYDVLYGLWNR